MVEPVRIVVDNRLRIARDQIPQWVQQHILNVFTHRNPKYEKLKALGYYAVKEQPFIRTYQVDPHYISVPRGGTERVRAVLRDHGFSWRFEDRSVMGVGVPPFPQHRVSLYEYQEEAVQAAIQRRNCIVRAPTGAGKTTLSIALLARLGLSTLVVVWSRALMTQWLLRIEEELGIPARDVGMIAEGRCNPKPLTIGMQQSIYRKVKPGSELARQFGLLIADELQRFAAKTFQESIEPFEAMYRIGISADETRADGKEFLIYDVFGGRAADIPHDTLVKQGFIMDVQIRVIPTDFDDPDYRDSAKPDFNHLLDSMTTDEARNELVARTVKLALSEGGKSVLVFSHRVQHCQRIDAACASEGIRSGLMLGTADWEARFQETNAGLRNGSVQVGIGTLQAIGQGIDIPRVERGIIATPIPRNRQQFGQVRGRMCRTAAGKDDAAVYYLWDRKLFGVKVLKNFIQWNKGNVLVGIPDGNGYRWVSVTSYIEDTRRRSSAMFGGHHGT